MPQSIVLTSAMASNIQVRNNQSDLIHDISVLGETDHPLTKVLAQISNNRLELWNVTKIDDQPILLVLKARYVTKKIFTRILHLPSMELLPHNFGRKIKGVIAYSSFDKNGILWLNQEAKGDTSKIYKITQDKKRVDNRETLFVES